MSSRKWKSEACIDETSESSSESAASTPNTARARSPAAAPPSCDEPQQGEEGPQQGEDTAMDVAEDSDLVRLSMSGDRVDGSAGATAQSLAASGSSDRQVPSTSSVGASTSVGEVAGDEATGGASEHPGDTGESAYRAQTCRLCNRDTLYLRVLACPITRWFTTAVGTAPSGTNSCQYRRRNWKRNVRPCRGARRIDVGVLTPC